MPRNSEESFRTHANYLRAFSSLMYYQFPYGRQNFLDYHYNRITDSGILPNRRNQNADLEQVKRSLHSAWGTEFLLLTAKRFTREDELTRLYNNWNCIQTYYIFYYCTQALFVAKGQQRPRGHTSTQNIYYDLWGSRTFNVCPWTFCCGPDGYRNVPDGIIIDEDIHSWAGCTDENIWSIAGKSLMTTRREAFKEKEKQRRGQKRRDERRRWMEEERQRLDEGRAPRGEPNFPLPRLTKEEKRAVDTSLRPFTLMDYLYRLRIKTNYVDSAMFTDGPVDEQESQQVRNYLCRIASNTLFLHELAVSNLVGQRTFEEWVAAWIEQNVPERTNSGLVRRSRFLGF